jgi:hypothetical protein
VLYLCEHQKVDVVVIGPDVEDADVAEVQMRRITYSQWVGRGELFERERKRNPDVGDWDSCVMASADVVASQVWLHPAYQPHHARET